MGCIQAAPDLRLVRLTYVGDQGTARSIEPAEIKTRMGDPLLRSANALRAIFHHCVVVTEADADRAFYDEVNYRLLAASRGLEDCLFLNAQNWQTIPRYHRPFRGLGIPAAAVFDLDVLMDEAFTKHVFPLLNLHRGKELTQLETDRTAIKMLLEVAGKTAVKSKGLGTFTRGRQGFNRSVFIEAGSFWPILCAGRRAGVLRCGRSTLPGEKQQG